MCGVCGEVRDEVFFPYKSRSECYECYEKIMGVKLHSFRERLRYENPGWQQVVGGMKILHEPIKKILKVVKKSDSESHYNVEVDRDTLLVYLKQQRDKGSPARLYYKDDNIPRTMNDFNFDDRYIYVPSGKGYNYLFRLDRVTKIFPSE